MRALSTISVSARPFTTAAVAVVSPAAVPTAVKGGAIQAYSDLVQKNPGTVVSPWNRYNIQDTSSFRLADARRNVFLGEVDPPTAQVTIYKQSRSAMVSGPAASYNWILRWPHAQKWGNPLMGYLSSADSLAPLAMHARFDSPEQAILYCERNGWRWQVEAPPARERTQIDNQYAHNFVSRQLALRMKTLGPRRTTAIFKHEGAGSAHFVNLRRSSFGAEPWLPTTGQTNAAWTGAGWPAPRAAKPDVHAASH